jgi:hypothetical protein
MFGMRRQHLCRSEECVPVCGASQRVCEEVPGSYDVDVLVGVCCVSQTSPGAACLAALLGVCRAAAAMQPLPATLTSILVYIPGQQGTYPIAATHLAGPVSSMQHVVHGGSRARVYARGAAGEGSHPRV